MSNVNGRQFYVITNLILIEDQLMLFMFYLEKRRIVACNMLAEPHRGLPVEVLLLRYSV